MENENIEIVHSFNYDDYQVVRREFFAHTTEPSVTFNNYKFYANMACINKLPNVNYVQVLINKDKKILALRPCDKETRDSFKWCNVRNERRKVRPITCKIFFMKIFDMMGWNLDYRYKLIGKIIKTQTDEILIAFDLTSTEIYTHVAKNGLKPITSKKPIYPVEWQNQFGLSYEEHRKSMQIDIFEGYAIYGIKDND